MKQVALSYEAVDSIVVNELKDAVMGIVNDPHTDLEADPHLTHLLSTLEYFAGRSEVEAFRQENPNIPDPVPAWDVIVDDLHDNPDGSCTITYRVGEKMAGHLIGRGLQAVVLEAVQEVIDAAD